MIVIIGGGISGLAAAYELARRGLPFRLLEASPRPGGLIQTDRCDGFTIDGGPDSLLATKRSAGDLCAELGLTPLLQDMQQPRTAFVLARGRLFPLPAPSVLGLPLTPGAALRFRLLPIHARVRVLLEPLIASRPAGADESIASFFTRRFGPAAAASIAQPLLGGIHAGDIAQLSVRSLFPNLLEAERTGSVLRGLSRGVSRPGGAFASLAGGMTTLPEAIVRSLPPSSVRYRAEVQAMAGADTGWYVDATGGGERATAVVLAAPMPVAARLLATVDEQAATLCGGIPHASTVSVAFAWPRRAIAHPLRGSGFIVAQPGRGMRVTACTWTSSKWEGRAPAGYALLRAFVGGMHDEEAIDLSDDQLVSVVTRDLDRVLGIRAAPQLTRVYRWRDASPQLHVGHDERVARVLRQLARCPGVFMTGRGFRAVGIPDCISDARRTAAEAADYVRSQNHATVDQHVQR
jgi:oxygen-dependent protoporphyrinogen oxidase